MSADPELGAVTRSLRRADHDPTATIRHRPAELTPGQALEPEAFDARTLPPLSLGPAPDLSPDVTLPRRMNSESPDLAVTAVLGEGGTGTVLLAYQSSMGREVAVKVPRDHEPWCAQTLLAEGRLAGRIEHPNVIPVYALGRAEDGAPVLVMKRGRGVPWETLLRDEVHPIWDAFAHGHARERLEAHLEILLSLVKAVSAAHRAGILHRDVKPANVLVGGPDDVYLIDWGLALDLRGPPEAANLVGTPAFMAPEMLGSGPVDERTDIYELGATLHYLLSGRHRNGGPTCEAIFDALKAPTPVSLPEAPPALAAIVVRATAFEPAARFASAQEFGDAIRAWLDQRAAERIATVAAERLDELARAVGEAGTSPSQQTRAALDRQAAACRATFESALALAPELPLAQEAAERYLALWVGHLIARGEFEAARAELDEGRAAMPVLEARLTQLQHDAHARLIHLTSLEQDHDLRPAAAARRGFFIGASVLMAVLTVFAFAVLPRIASTEDKRRLVMLAVAVSLNLLFWTVLWRWRKRLLVNAASRNIMLWVAVLLGYFLVHRVLGWVLPGEVPTHRRIADEILVTGVFSAFAAVAMTRRFWPAPLIATAGYVAALSLPDYARQCLTLVMLGTLITAARAWGRTTSDDRDVKPH